MSDDWNEDDVSRALRKLAQKIPKQDDLQKAQNDAKVTQAQLKAEMFAAPKFLAMKQNIEQNVPLAKATADAVLKATMKPEPTRDAGELDAPAVRQPIQQSREFPSNPAGQADQEAYITRIRQAMKNAAMADKALVDQGVPKREARVPEVQTPKSISYDTDPGMSGPRATQRDKVRPASSSLVPSGGYARAEKPEDVAKREADHMLKYLKGSPGVHKRGRDQTGSRDPLDEDSLGPSGEWNTDEPDYNYVAHPSPLNVAEALATKNGSISPETEAYMRREGDWGESHDRLIKDRGLRKKQ